MKGYFIMIAYFRIFFTIISFIFFNTSLLAGQLLQEVDQQNYSRINIWDPHYLHPYSSGHVSLSIKNNDNIEHVSLYKGDGDFGVRWGNNLDVDIATRGRNPNHAVRLFSLNRTSMNQWIDNNRQHIQHHQDGDNYAGEGNFHNCSSIVVNILREGGVSELFLRDQDWFGTYLWSATKGVISTGGVVTASVAYLPGLVIGGVGAGVAAGQATVGLGSGVVRETRASILDSFHTQKYGHPVLAPVCNAPASSDRYFPITVHQMKDFIKKCKINEKRRYPGTSQWW